MAKYSLEELSKGVLENIAKHTPVIQKDVKEIKDAICGTSGILATLVYISEELSTLKKKDAISKLKSANKQKIASKHQEKLIKNTNSMTSLLGKILAQTEKNGRGGTRLGAENFRNDRRRLSVDNFKRDPKAKHLEGLSRSIEIVEKLKNLKLKDFLFAKKKMRNIDKIMSRSLNMFKKFKDQKEIDGTIGLVNDSIEIMNKLKKVSKFSILAKSGLKTIEKIFTGGKKNPKGGLLGLFKKIAKNEPIIKVARKSIKDIKKSCGAFLLTTIILTGIAVLAIPAMLGALLMKGVVWLLIGTYKVLSKSGRIIKKGSVALLMMSASIIAFGLGLGLMAKAVKGMKLKDVGIMLASIVGIGLSVAGIGLLALPIAIGSTVMIIMAASLGLLGLALRAWQSFDSKKSMDNVKEAIGGMREAFGLDLGKGDNTKPGKERLKGKLLDIGLAILDFGKTFFMMGSILLAGAALGMLYHGLKNWDKFNGKKAAGNVKIAVGALKDAFGLDDGKAPNAQKKSRIGGKLLDIGLAILDMGKTFIQMGTLVFATAMMDIIRLTLIPWEKYNAKPAADNMKKAVTALKDVFGLDDRNGQEPKAKARGGLGDLIGLASSIFQMGSVFVTMGTLVFATAMMDIIRVTLMPWEKYDATNAIGNMQTALNGLMECFGLKKGENIDSPFKDEDTGLFALGKSLIKMGTRFAQMGTLLIATGAMAKIRENLDAWKNYDMGDAIDNIQSAITRLVDVFGLRSNPISEQVAQNVEGKTSFWKKVGNGLKKAFNAVTTPFRMAGNLVQAAEGLSEGGKMFGQMSALIQASTSMLSIKASIEPWETFNPDNSIKHMQATISGLYGQVFDVMSQGNVILKAKNFKKASKDILKGVKQFYKLHKKKYDEHGFTPFKETIASVNSLDMEKATKVIDLFKSFSKIGRRPVNKFVAAVEQFSDSCEDLITALNKFEGVNTSNNSGEETSSVNTTSTTNMSTDSTKALAQAIAEAMKSLPVNVHTDISDVKLVVNGESGRRVVLSLDN